jgi:hypothetical protein
VAANHSTFGERRPVPTGNTLLNESFTVHHLMGTYSRNELRGHEYLGNRANSA